MLPGPICYYRIANHYAQTMDARGWRGSGLDWIGEYNEGRTAAELPLYSATAYLTSWEWPRARDVNWVNVRTRRLLCGSCIVIGALLALGIFPWRSRRRWANCAGVAQPGCGAVAGGSTNRGGVGLGNCPLGWRPMIWLAVWIVLPAYGCYLFSLPRGITPAQVHGRPQDWLWALWGLARAHRGWASAGVAIGVLSVIASARGFRRQAAGFGRIALVVALPLGLCALLAWARVPLDQYAHAHWGAPWDEHESVWMPRYLGVSLPAVLLVTALLLLRLPMRPLRIGAVALVLIVNLSQYGARVWACSEPPTDLIAADILASQEADGPVRTFCRLNPIGVGFGAPGSGLLNTPTMNYYLYIESGRPANPSLIVRISPPPFVINSPMGFIPMAMYVRRSVAASSEVRRVVVWEVLSPGQIDHSDKVLDVLTGWRRVEDELFPVRDHWTWRDLYVCRRRVYERDERQAPAAVLPATRQSATGAPASRTASTRAATTRP
jgi:hypothetical protein